MLLLRGGEVVPVYAVLPENKLGHIPPADSVVMTTSLPRLASGLSVWCGVGGGDASSLHKLTHL